jgi:multidrug efflux pump subunit AcrA (membrane-fusion protein)
MRIAEDLPSVTLKTNMAGKWLLISVAAVLAGVGAGALSLHWKGRTAAPSHSSGAALISTAAEVTFSGKLRPQHVTTVGADAEGNVDAFLVDVGDEVFVGEALARIGASALESQREVAAAAATNAEGQVARAESSVASARLEASRADADQQRSKAALEKQRANFERQQTLNRSGATPRLTWEKAQHDFQLAQQDFDLMDKAARLAADQVQAALNALSDAKSGLLQRQQELETAQGNMQSAEVRSPVDGTVVARNGEPGKPAADDLFTIATDLYALEVPLEPPPAVLQRLRPGQPALVLLLDLQSAGIAGQVKEIKDNQAIVEFTCALPAVRPGMRVDVRLKLE